MVTRPFLFMIVCFGLLMLIQSLVPKAMAMKKSSNIDEFTLDDQRTRKRKNYVLQMARDRDPFGNIDNMGTSYDNMGVPELFEPYDPELFEPNANPDELSALLVDYANMIRNDVILLDNAVETRTRKRGNIKVEKHNQAISDPPCYCDYSNETEDLGEHSFPRFVETRNCSKVQQQKCAPPYVCRENLYDLPVLRRRQGNAIESSLELPSDLKFRYIAVKRPISVGCVCTNEYLVNNN